MKLAFSAPSQSSRAREWMPSAATTASARALVPSAKRSVTPPLAPVEIDELLVERDALASARARPAPRAGRRDASADRARRISPRRRRRAATRSSACRCPSRDWSRSAAGTRWRGCAAQARCRAAPAWRSGSSGCRRRGERSAAPARRFVPSMPRWWSAAASVSPPIPAPMIASEGAMKVTMRRAEHAGPEDARRACERLALAAAMPHGGPWTGGRVV